MMRSLILLEGIDFDCPDSGMDFQTFQIRRFSDAELAEILGNRVNRIFYRRSVIECAAAAGLLVHRDKTLETSPYFDSIYGVG